MIQQLLGVALTSTLTLTGFITSEPSKSQITPRIVGGIENNITETPWHVGVIAGASLCGGSAISETVIITAAHCVDNSGIEKIKIFNDSSQLDQVRTYQGIQNLVIHPHWDRATYRNDIALLTTSAPLLNVKPLELPVNYIDENRPKKGEKAQIVGWGSTQNKINEPSQILQKAEIEILIDYIEKSCGQYAVSLVDGAPGYDNTINICAGRSEGGVDACQGDSGGGLTIRENNQEILAGVVSVGFECAKVGYPGIYTRVSSYLDWIDQNTGLVTLAKTRQEPNLAEIVNYINPDKALQTQQLHNYAASKNYTTSALPLDKSMMSENRKYYLTENTISFIKRTSQTVCVKNYDLTTLTETEECLQYNDLAKKMHMKEIKPYIDSIKNTTKPKKLWQAAYKNKLVKNKKMPKNFTNVKQKYNKITISKPKTTMKIVTKQKIADQNYQCASTLKISGKKTRLLKTRCSL